MNKLEKFNAHLDKNASEKLVTKYKLKEEDIKKIVKVQQKIRQIIIKRNFFKVMRMNDYIEHRKNFVSLKKSLI